MRDTRQRGSMDSGAGKSALTQQVQPVIARKVGGETLVARLEAATDGAHGKAAQPATSADGATAAARSPRTPAEAARLARTGTRIELPYRAEIEAQLGRDLSNVEVYVGPAAVEACAALGAEAFTVGHTIAFASPHPPKTTVMHEITHVLQQGGDQAKVDVPGDVGVTAPGGAEEHEAEAAEAAGPAKAEPAAPAQGGPPTAARKPALAMKPGKDAYCKTTATFELVAKKGGSSQGKLPAGSLVQVTALDGTGFDVMVMSGGALTGKTGYLPDGALTEAQGIIGNQVFNQGRLGGELDGTGTKINCLGHASGEKRAAYITNGTTEDMLKGLGFTCIVGDSTVLAPYIKAGKYAMMVYMYMYKSSWREPDDQALSYADLAKKYGWSTSSWQQPNVYFGPKGEDRPIDYHALDYNAKTKKWEWVANNRPREKPPDYNVDSKGTEPAALNPDDYFGSSGQVLVSIACYK
jgi:uncharacterized protein DUF4157